MVNILYKIVILQDKMISKLKSEEQSDDESESDTRNRFYNIRY